MTPSLFLPGLLQKLWRILNVLWTFKQAHLLLCLQNVILILFRVKQLFKNVTKRSALRQESYVWQGYGQVSIMVVTSHGSGLHPLTSVNVKKLTECLKNVSLDPAAEPENPSVLVSVAPIM